MVMQKQLEGNKMWTVVPTAYALLVNLDVFSINYLGKKKCLVYFYYCCNISMYDPNMYIC